MDGLSGNEKAKYGKTYILLVTENSENEKHNDLTALANADKLKFKGLVDGKFGGRLPGKENAPVTRKLFGDFNEPNFIDNNLNELRNLDGNDKLYIVGHGTYGVNPTVGGKTPNQLATFLSNKGLRQVKVISLVACNAGWGNPNESFGELFGVELAKVGIHTEIRARNGYVTVLRDGRKIVEFSENKILDFVAKVANKLYFKIPEKWSKSF